MKERRILSLFRFVPDLTDIPAFAELATAEGLGPEAVLLILFPATFLMIPKPIASYPGPRFLAGTH